MIGNDIVDLKQATKDSPDSYRDGKRFKRFLDKVFTTDEQQFIVNAQNKEAMVWKLWSMKEAAYKVYVQQFGRRFFNPRRLKCQLISKTQGIVVVEDVIYKTVSTLTEVYIYTVATNSFRDARSVCFQVENTSYKSQSNSTKKHLIKTFSEIKGTSKKALRIKKNALGVPQLFQDNVKQKELFSMTHHGRYCAYAIL